MEEQSQFEFGKVKKSSILLHFIISLFVIALGFTLTFVALNISGTNATKPVEKYKYELSEVEVGQPAPEPEPSQPQTPQKEPEQTQKPTQQQTNQTTTASSLSSKFSKDVNLSSKRKEYNNNEIVGRLEIPGVFNILVTKTSNNKFYLDHSLSKKSDKKGTEFLDFRTNVTDQRINIYGHNSRTYDIPFRKLERFLNKSFFDANPYILLQHDKGRRYYKIFSIKEVTTDNEHMIVAATGDRYITHIKTLLANSLYTRSIEYDVNSSVLVLQTCSYTPGAKHYYVISAIEVK